MDEFVSAADANRKFSAILRQVRNGRSYVITSHGRVVARIVPATEGEQGKLAQTGLFQRLSGQPATDSGRWTRDELYEDET